MKLNKNIAIAVVCVLLGIMLALQYKSINYKEEVSSYEHKTLEELKDNLLIEKRKNEELMVRYDELQNENRQYELAQGDIDKNIENIKKDITKYEIISGLADVKGKGIILTIDNVEIRMPLEGEEDYNFKIEVQERELLEVINELRASDANAISINDERIVATTEIAEVDDGMIINGVKVSAPYEIKALGDPEKLENSLTMLNGVVEGLQSYQLEVSLEKSDEIIIPKARGSVIRTNLLKPANK